MPKHVHSPILPDLLEMQRSSFCWFLLEGLAIELNHFSGIFALNEKVELRIYGNVYWLKKPSFTPLEAKERGITYAFKLYVLIDLVKTESPEKAKVFSTLKTKNKAQKALLGEIPLMTQKGTFIVNGCERVVVSQIVRSPGVFFTKTEKKKNQSLTSQKKKKETTEEKEVFATVITQQGSWLTFELCHVKQTTFVKQCKCDHDIDKAADEWRWEADEEKECSCDYYSLWVKIDKTYVLPLPVFFASLGLTKQEIYDGVKHAESLSHCLLGTQLELMAKPKYKKKKIPRSLEVLDKERAFNLIQRRLVHSSSYTLGKAGRLKLNKKLNLRLPLTQQGLTALDILKIIDYLLDLHIDTGNVSEDFIDSLSNRRVRCVGELIQSQLRIGLNRVRANIEEALKNEDEDSISLSPTTLVNPKPLVASMRQFFGSSQLSQFMDEINPLAELTHKRRITSLGPGGLSTDHVSYSARDIQPTQYGRLCPIETPEGQNAGLVSSLASHARLNRYGFLITPFFRVSQGRVLRHLPPVYLGAEKEKDYKIALADTKLKTHDVFQNKMVVVSYLNEFTLVSSSQVEFIAVSPIQLISVAAALIPFLEHDDANRALMGSNMQRQAVSLIYPHKPIVGTGLETQIAKESYTGLVNYRKGRIHLVTGSQIVVQSRKKRQKKAFYKHYKLEKYLRSNQGSCINQRPLVWPGQWVQSGQLLADGPASEGGELALGQNLTVAYMPWEGYNYEDAVVISERLKYMDLFTSVHIDRYEIDVKQTKVGSETLTKDIPFATSYSLRHLTSEGVVKKGAFVGPGDVLLGKVVPKEESDLLPEERLLKAIFGGKTPDVEDTSFRVPKGMYGRVLDVFVFSKEEGDEVPFGAVSSVRIFIAEVRKIKIGDKVAGRHGNKGIISQIVPIQDMPYLPDGTVVDLLFNPLGVPSRMNVGQIFESLLGLAGDQLQKRFKVLPFDERYTSEASRILINTKLQEAAKVTKKPWLYNEMHPGKMWLVDGRSGERFDNPILVGKSYILKLIHLVDDKMHARSTGPYALVTQQPVGGKSQQGGQRFGEMEVWALEAFGAAYTLQELLTLKSDDLEGRNNVFLAMVKGQPMPKPGVPESFKVLLCELKALALDIKTYRVERVKSGQSEGVEVNLTKTNLEYEKLYKE